MTEAKEFAVGDRVRIVTLPPYVKTADPMPMLRPPHVVYLGEEGTVVDRRPGGYWSVRFAKGTFLLDSQYLEVVSASNDDSENHATSTGSIQPIAEDETK